MKADLVARTILIIVFVIVIFTISVSFVEKQKYGEKSIIEKEKLRGIQTALANLQNELHTIKDTLIVKEDGGNEGKTIELYSGGNHTKLLASRDYKILHENVHKTEQRIRPARKKAIIFTMDSISSYEKNSLAGGAAGKPLH